MIPGIEFMSAQTKAHIMADIIKTGKSGNDDMAIGSRDFDSLTEMGDGQFVIKEFLKLYHGDSHLQAAVRQFDRYIGIDKLLADPSYHIQTEPSLSEGIKWINWYRQTYNVTLIDAKRALDSRKAEVKSPTVVVYAEGGQIQHVAGTIDAEVAVIDYDGINGDAGCRVTLSSGDDAALSVFVVNPDTLGALDREVVEESRIHCPVN